MLKSNPAVFFIEDVPSNWIFESYLNLNEKLTGQSIKIHSIFKAEKTPSMCIYYSDADKMYKYKDFSTDKSGNGAGLVSDMFNISYAGACSKIMDDYNLYLSKGDLSNDDQIRKHIIPTPKYKITEFVTRGWNNIDAAYWLQFGIGSDVLKHYGVVPLQEYTMCRQYSDGKEEVIKIARLNVYGYFNKQGDLCKVYQPMQKNKKFIKVNDYIQGSDQLTETNKYLVICSSLKDVMALKAMKFNNIDAIAPDSENSRIPKEIMSAYLERYTTVCTMFDDDVAGIKSMQKYKDDYGIESIHLQMSKDLSDSIRDYGISNVKIVLHPILKKVLTPKSLKHE